MINLHKFYYKDYFSEYIKEVDKGNDSLSFNYIIKEEEKNRALSPDEKRQIEQEISKITTKNKAIIKERNDILIGNRYSVKENNEYRLKAKARIPFIDENEDSGSKDFHYIPLRISYPGLVTGVGIDHEAKIEGEFKLGVHFDWTYGMPVIYGSSVKGVLRSWFKEFYDGSRDSYDYEMEIFEGKLRDTEAEKKKYGQNWEEKVKVTKNRIFLPKSIYDRDIFFDAVITAPDKKGRILCSDSITPHGDNPLKNPTPITFLKIASGCKLKFRFKLAGSEEEKELKRKLFKEILTTVGVGAKTNVGYGQLKEAK